MVGIVSCGAYIPRYRLSRKTIAAAMGWFNPQVLPGEKAVANYDEDSITMAVAAGFECLKEISRKSIDAIYFASTTSPYRERQGSGIIAGALDLRPDLRAADLTDSVKAGTGALLAATDAVKAGEAGNVLVCAADCRLGKAGSLQEQIFGDGGAALLVGTEGVIASLEGSYSLSFDFPDHRRAEQDRFDRSWEDRWIRDEGYLKFMPMAARGLFGKYGLEAGDFAKAVLACPYGREHASIGKQIGFPPEKVQDNMITSVGDTGAAYPLMVLMAALEDAKPGDRILLVSYGNGCDALCFRVTEEIGRVRNKKGIKGCLSVRKDLNSYQKYLAFRNMIPMEVGVRGEEITFTQLSTLWRERKTVLALGGVRCKNCGTPQYPRQRVCVNPECGAVDQMEDYSFADKKGRLFTYTGDNLAFSISPPAIYGIVDFDGGGRYMFDLIDCELADLKVGMAVEMSFRRKYADQGRGIIGYFWKAVPTEGVI